MARYSLSDRRYAINTFICPKVNSFPKQYFLRSIQGSHLVIGDLSHD